MPTITWTIGDVFYSAEQSCYGMVLPNTTAHQPAVMLTAESREGHYIWTGPVPKDALPQTEMMPYEITAALCAVVVALGLTSRAYTQNPPFMKMA